MKQLRTAHRIRYADMFKTTYNSLIKFNGHLDIHFSDIDIARLKRYEAFMKSENLASNTLETRFVRLRTIYNLAIEEKIVKPEYYPFGTYKVSKLKQKTAKRSIPKCEVLTVLDYKGKTDYERLSIDLFTFSYLTVGINFVDMSNLKHDNVIDDRLSYIRMKTKKVITIPLQPKAIELINKCADKDNPYLFSILNKFHKTEQQKANRRHKVISKVNKCLKEIGKELNIQINLTTYVARHINNYFWLKTSKLQEQNSLRVTIYKPANLFYLRHSTQYKERLILTQSYQKLPIFSNLFLSLSNKAIQSSFFCHRNLIFS